MKEDDFLRLLDAIYDASLDDSQWSRITDLLKKQFPYTFSSMAFYDGAVDIGPIKPFGDFDDDSMKTYEEHFATVNPWIEINRTTPVGRALRSSDYLPTQEFRKSEFYNDWLAAYDGVDEGIGSVLFREDDRMALLGIHYKSAKIRPEQIRDLARLTQAITPHIQRAIELRRMVGGLTLYADTLEQTLDRLGNAVVVARHDGLIRYVNRAAEFLLKDNDCPILSRAGRISLQSNTLQETLLQHLREATLNSRGSNPLRRSNALKISDAQGTAYVALVFPLIANMKHSSILGHTPIFQERRAIIFIVDPKVQRQTPESLIIAAFGVSEAEARLASAFCDGETIADYAEMHQLSKNTVRNQLQSLLDKLGVNRQSELVRLLNRTFGHLEFQEDG